MQLDRFTEKAQEAIVAGQQLAERLQSPLLDAEHILSALIEPDDGVPAETLRRLGVDLPAFRGDGFGDLYARVRVVLPTRLDEDARQAARELVDAIQQPDPRTTN